MITQAILTALQATLQQAYSTAGSLCTVAVDWPDPQDDPVDPVLILHEGDEYDANIGNGMRGNPMPPTYSATPDTVLLTYRQRAVSRQPGVTTQQAQAVMRADKAVLLTLFRQGDPSQNLGGAVQQAGKVVTVRHPATGPYEESTSGIIVRFTWKASIMIWPHNR